MDDTKLAKIKELMGNFMDNRGKIDKIILSMSDDELNSVFKGIVKRTLTIVKVERRQNKMFCVDTNNGDSTGNCKMPVHELRSWLPYHPLLKDFYEIDREA